MELVNALIDQSSIPVLTGFLLGLVSAISPCTLAANVAAVAFIAKEITHPRKIILNGWFYVLGRGLSYAILFLVIVFGASSFSVASIFSTWGSFFLGPILILFGLITAGIIKFRINRGKWRERASVYLASKGYFGSFLLGMLLALAFCPYSGIFFFGVLIPLSLATTEGLILPFMFAFGTGLPVLVFSFLIAFSLKKVGSVFNIIQKIEKPIRLTIATIFLIMGTYYFWFLLKFLINNYN